MTKPWWLISTTGLGFRFRLGFQTLWLHSIMQNMFPLTQIQIWIPFPNGYCTHFRDGSLSQGQISVPFHAFQSWDNSLDLNQWKKSCIVQESVSKSESESESGNRNKLLVVSGRVAHQNEAFKVVILIIKFILNHKLLTLLDLDPFYF